MANAQTVTTNEDTAKPITLTGSDADGDALTYAIVVQPSRGTLTGTGANRTYTPSPNLNGADLFTFKVNDGKVDSATVTVAINVTPVNDPPTLSVPGAQTAEVGQSLSFNLSANDPDQGQTLNFTANNMPSGATLTMTGATSARFNWTPSTNQLGSFIVNFVVSDNGSPALGDTEAVAINVGPACATPPTGLLSWYRAEGNANDKLNAHPGTLRNGVAFGAGRVGQAFMFDGIDDAVELGNWSNLQTFTLALWVKPGATQTAFANIIDNNHTDSRAWVLQQNGNTLNQYIWGVAGIQPVITFNLTADVWQYVVMTLDANRVTRVYVNGVQVGQSSGAQAPIYDGTQFLRLGAWGGGERYWRGQLDEVDIYNRALTVTEIQALFTAGSTGKCL